MLSDSVCIVLDMNAILVTCELDRDRREQSIGVPNAHSQQGRFVIAQPIAQGGW